MEIISTDLKDCFILRPEVFQDRRGYFFEAFNEQALHSKIGSLPRFVQDNESQSEKGVIRGLHFQTGEHSQAKLIRVVSGRIWDVAVDLRSTSPTFQQWIGVELSAENKKQLFVPRGFAHGYAAIEPSVIIYKCDAYYHPKSEGGVRYDDPQLAIDWKVPEAERIVSSKDLVLPNLAQALININQ